MFACEARHSRNGVFMPRNLNKFAVSGKAALLD